MNLLLVYLLIAYLMNSEAEGMPSSINWSCTQVTCTGPCTKGQPVYAIADGKVSMNGNGPNGRYCFRNKKRNC